MSIKVSSWIWEHSEQKSTKLLMLLALADAANDDGICWPGHQHLADKCRLSKDRARDILKELKDDGEIEIEVHKGLKTTSGYTNRYSILSYRKYFNLGQEGVNSPTLNEQKPQEGVNIPTHEGVNLPNKPISLPVKEKESAPKNGANGSNENKAIGELIKVWLDEQKIIDDAAYRKTGYRTVARGLVKAGITPEDVQAFIRDKRKDPFYADKTVSWNDIQKNIIRHKEQQKPTDAFTTGMRLING